MTDEKKTLDYKEFRDEWFELSRELENHGAIFYAMHSISEPMLTTSKSMPTAGVRFNTDEGEAVEFVFNSDFWLGLTHEQKLFVISHECLHIFFNHGMRMRPPTDNTNIAQDVVINEMLVNTFGFNRKNIDPENEYVWLDKPPFKDKALPNQSAEYYLKFLDNDKSGGKNGESGKTVDDHSGMQGTMGSGGDPDDKACDGSGGDSKDPMDSNDIRDKLLGNMTNDELDEILNNSEVFEEFSKGCGHSAGSGEKVIIKKNIVQLSKWAQILVDRFEVSEAEEYKSIWTQPDRRLACMGNRNVYLPTYEMEPGNDAITVWLFQDTSGSCASLFQTFFDAAMTIPSKHFKIKFHCFDTRVHEVDMRNPVAKGFGGTSFTCIEDYIIRNTIAQNRPYPEAVFVLTDAQAGEPTLKHCDRWYWFLTNPGYTGGVPHACNIYDLQTLDEIKTRSSRSSYYY